MPELPKPRRVDIWTARRYIAEVCGLDSWRDVDPAFFDALCNDDLHFEGELNTSASYNNRNPVKSTERIPAEFWKDWGYHAFAHGVLNNSVVPLPDQDSHYKRPFYTNLTIATADIDAWLNASQNLRVRVIAVPEKAYKERIDKAIAMEVTYSRGEDREWAKAHGYSVESVQEMRRKHTPPEWREAGRRANQNPRSKKSATESAG